ncbi:GAF and ANTAR domain-containing protein [Arthrobacter agilis]|uniref:GAF and ANTAR domain-containing protein n=1 Tax=Arthrobacter agilis TaxID=37921 RepID=UPI000B352CA9|nr:GAF and ANTAR domain-containing protein [Arthrobacter agilis]OUM42911.1 histidine kinase [Arthrobacter agilis]PPB45856.1 ANTAR domain-containing protein [Arthrobacter agilis]TPV25398.1 GAF and ANTAR domain-containing protein [Arthrobacter agilis]WDF32766.1 GAF and ANTAR domain-containing protein [Arthrobacter agilis]VDR33132.1 Signal transduction protein containing GAF and PtsI domains [Arthrobacter agilis]
MASDDGSDAREGGWSAPQDDVASKLSDFARSLQREDSEAAVLDRLVRAAIDLVPGADEASITLVTARRRVASRAPSSELARLVDELQERTGEGPCLSAVYDERTVRVPDLRTEGRWPEFSSRAADAGAGSMLSFQLFVEGDNLGALNLIGCAPNAFTAESEYVGALVASHAAVAFADAQKLHQFEDAIATRDLIGQAKGILMERYGITSGQAFLMLVRVSTDTNTKLLAVADELANTGSLPERRRKRGPAVSG